MVLYFTFGIGQPNSGRYVKITAPDIPSARKKMFELFGSKWGFMYDSDQWENYSLSHETLAEKWGWELLDEYTVIKSQLHSQD